MYNDDVRVTCRAFYGGAAYAAVWLPVEVTTSTTTLEWTYPAYTTLLVLSPKPLADVVLAWMIAQPCHIV